MRLAGIAVGLGCLTDVIGTSCADWNAACTCHETMSDYELFNTKLKIDSSTARNACEMKILRKNFRTASNDWKRQMFQSRKKMKAMAKKEQALCRVAEEKYVPFGLDELIPDSWECEFDQLGGDRLFEDFSHQDLGANGERIPNVIMLGAKGAGKSYFGNGLLGAPDPCPQTDPTKDKTNYFGCGTSTVSVTRNVKAQYGMFFGDHYNKYGVTPMEVNIYDTPGFFDTDPDKILSNKRLIAKQLDIEIDAFMYLLGENPRINSNTQDVFAILQQWTLGRVWSNFIIVYARASFANEKLRQRARDDDDFIGKLSAKLDAVKAQIWEKSQRDNWQIRSMDGIDRPMIESDFDGIRMSMINVAQNKYCKVNNDTTSADFGLIPEEEDLCWKMPRREPDDIDVYTDDAYDEDTYWDIDSWSSEYEEISFPPDGDFFHIVNMKKLQNDIKDFSQHPVKTEKYELKKYLMKDIEEFQQEFSSVIESEYEVAELFQESGIDNSECQNSHTTRLAALKSKTPCPRWGLWERGNCSKTCGPGSRIDTRECFNGFGEVVDANICEREYEKNNERGERVGFCNEGECGEGEC